MKKTLVSLAILLGVCLSFFWPIFKGYIPFPGDILVSTNPYRSVSILGYTPGSYPNKAQGRDVITEMFPWKYFEIAELKKGKIPFWNPYNFSGNILMQNLQSAVFNPTNLVFFLFSFPKAWTIFILLQPVLASFFFFLFMRELKVSRFASTVGSMGFAFSAYMTVWMEYGNIAATIAYLPLLLFFILKFLKTKSKWSYSGFVAAVSIMFLSGYIQAAFYCYVVAACFVFVAIKTLKIKPTIRLAIFILFMFALPIFLTSFQLFSTYQVFLSSTRWPYGIVHIREMLQPPFYWATYFVPDLFGNPATRNYYLQNSTYIERVISIGTALGIFALFGLIKRREYSFFFLSVAILVGILTTNFPGVAFFYTLPIPVINTTVPTRMLSIFMFGMLVLATFGIDELFKKKKFPIVFLFFVLSVYFCIWIGLVVVGKFNPQIAMEIAISKRNLLMPTLLAFGTVSVFFFARKFQKGAQLLLFSLIFIDLLYGFHKITPFAPPETVYPANPVTDYIKQHAGINRYWGFGSGYIEPNYQTFDGTYSPEGNDPLHMRTYGELLASSSDGKLPTLPPRPDANLAPGYGQEGMQNPYRQTLLNLLGVKYIVQHDELRLDNAPDTATFPQDTYALAWAKSPWQIYENKKVLPRYFLVSDYVVAKNQKALDLLYNIDLNKTVVLSDKLPFTLSSNATGSSKLLSYDTQKIIFQTDTSDTMLLFLSDTYFPSWNAKIDNINTPVYLADYSFRAVAVPKGVHTVTMYYQPLFFTIGLRVSIIAFGVFLLSLILFKKYEKKL